MARRRVHQRGSTACTCHRSEHRKKTSQKLSEDCANAQVCQKCVLELSEKTELPGKMCERFIGVGHAVDVVSLGDCSAFTLVRS